MNGMSSSTPRTSAEEIYDDLRERIGTGVLKAGDRLPTQAVLAGEFGVERGTVRQALQRLRADGLLVNVSKGSPPQVAPRAGRPVGSRSARSLLGPRLVAAFEEPQVRVDVACLTAETLMVSLGDPLRHIYENPASRPESVHVRVLLPRADQYLDYPAPEKGWGHDERLDDAVHRRSVAQMRAQRTVLENNLNGLRRLGDIEVRLEFRELTGTPTRKVYLLNRREALIGHYIPGRALREVDEYDQQNPVALCDVDGMVAPMFVFATDESASEASFVEAEQLMFDRVWEHVARESQD